MMSYDCVLLFSSFVLCCSILWCAREKDVEKGAHPHFDVPVLTYELLGRRNSFDLISSASATASELAVQLPAPASSLAVPPPAASTAEAVNLSAGGAILADPGPAAGAAAVYLYLS